MEGRILIYPIVVMGLNTDIEEEISFKVNDILITGFMPFGLVQDIEVGKEYLVQIDLTILDDINLKEMDSPLKEFKRIGNSFAYIIRGYFDAEEQTIDAGIKVELDSEYLDGHWYLHSKYIEITVDRISVTFIEE